MALKIRGLGYKNSIEAMDSVLKMERMSISDELRLRDADMLRYVARVAAKRSSDPNERSEYKKAESIYSTYVIRLKKRIKSKK